MNTARPHEPIARERRRHGRMRRLKRGALTLGAGFVLFAPPGTLVVTAVLIAGLIGKKWLIAVVALAAVALLLGWFVRRRNSRAK